MKRLISLNSMDMALFVTSLCLLAVTSEAQFGFGCSTRGCSNHGTFAFATPLPPRPRVTWTWRDDWHNDTNKLPLGCSSSMSTVLCPTSDGYIALTPSSGQLCWQSSIMTSSYLPSVDFYGNALISSSDHFLKVSNGGTKQTPDVKTSQFQPEFGAVKIDYSTTLILSSRTDAPQVIIYGNDDNRKPKAVLHLRDTVSNVSGTFVPNSDPLINSSRAYISTRFVPDNNTIVNRIQSSPIYRVYAIDLPQDTNDSMAIAWFVDVPVNPYDIPLAKPNDEHLSTTELPNPGMLFYNNTVYINYQIPMKNTGSRTKRQPAPPPPFRLCAIYDLGDKPHIVFTVFTAFGPMAIYDLSATPFTNITTGRRTLWIGLANYHVFYGHDPVTGDIVSCIDLSHLAPEFFFGLITSRLSVSRQLHHPDRDVLLFGFQDSNRHGHVMAVEVDSGLKPRLLWSVNVTSARPDSPTNGVEWKAVGQLASVTSFTDSGFQFGVVVSVLEIDPKLKSSRLAVHLLM